MGGHGGVNRTEPILTTEHLATLTGFALSNVLVAFDYDGTLAPIAARPEDAHMRPSTRRLLASVAGAYPTVVISGRALADVTAMLRRVPLWYIYGNHGLEPSRPGATPASGTTEWIARLLPRLPPDLGIRIEDKGHTLTLHFRGVPDRARALAAIEEAVEALPDVSILRGKEAINVLPRGAGNKGVALAQAMATFACHQAIYVGDEDTDEAAFAHGGNRVLSIRVERSRQSHARYHIDSQLEIDTLLRALLEARLGPLHPRG
jgi:trehalose 6-phosphate phosphatase